MSVANQVRKFSSLSANGIPYAGDVEEINPPKIETKTEDFQAGGMFAPLKLKMGLNALEMDYTLIKYAQEIIGLIGLREGNEVAHTIRESLESYGGQVTASVHTLRGNVVTIDPGTSKAGDKPTLKVSLALSYYKLEVAGAVVHEIDIPNMIWIANGVDQMAAHRAALGI